ncbi:hypothetical protein B4135_1822 [Caldibacillus debilis]|uniref:Uncharacterized protein n=1 Tax=Caldibacillus debilis TaxID=301148 RepID=A0A150M829_9BACI|nr:hypothetical protein B4135_1822 [Caldibacillus debilis]
MPRRIVRCRFFGDFERAPVVDYLPKGATVRRAARIVSCGGSEIGKRKDGRIRLPRGRAAYLPIGAKPGSLTLTLKKPEA